MKRKIYIDIPLTDIIDFVRERGKITTEALIENVYDRTKEKICLVFLSEQDLPVEEIGKENLSDFLQENNVTVRLYNAVFFSLGHHYSSKNKLEFDRGQLERILTVNDLLEYDSYNLIKFRNFGPKTLGELQNLLKNQNISEEYPIMRKII